MRLGTRGLRGVTAQVFHYCNKYTHTHTHTHTHTYIYIYIKVYFTTILRSKTTKKAEERWGGPPKVTGAVTIPNTLQQTVIEGQRFKTRSTIGKISRADFGSWGISWIASRPRSTRTLEILMTHYDSCSASVARSPSILSTCAWALSSSADRSHPSVGCRPHSSSSAYVPATYHCWHGWPTTSPHPQAR
jgi:hypothetical protein